ncbi:hypothetical protein QW060_27460 [Myroides ceti]|uniref:Uncharacterized protein n=1 Tax=Paenimyroides ceti TaxID=395087 RepID=A0ABT8D237_9FLAO|nr:hypothetical protein [Paenimyroides ceti]MDN3710534.1 hypothetical protein [Paenimyroides ceti]
MAYGIKPWREQRFIYCRRFMKTTNLTDYSLYGCSFGLLKFF